MKHRWTPDEEEMLQQLAVDHPPDRVPTLYRTWAGSNGYVMRSASSIRSKLVALRITDKATGDWVNTGYVCKLLGISFDMPHRWTDKYGIPAHRDGHGRRYFSRRELRRIARDHPERFAGINADRLFLLLEDRQLADGIAAAYPSRPMESRPVRAIETGWLYQSVREASKRVGAHRSSIQRSIRTGTKAGGYHWTYA